MNSALATALLSAAGIAYAGAGIEPLYLFGEYTAPHGDLIQDADGNFYGTTLYGGSGGTGVVYRLTPEGAYTELHRFESTDDNYINADGANPQAGVTFGADGNLYGTIARGGPGGTGAVYRLTLTDPPVYTVLHTFDATDFWNVNAGGATPFAALTLASDGRLYGSTSLGGRGGNGTLFRITPQGEITTLHEFNMYTPSSVSSNSDGAQPQVRMVAGPDGHLYGITIYGGAHGWGTLFRLTTRGDFKVMHAFGKTDAGANREPITLALGPDGAFYGTVSASGFATNENGGLFRFSLKEGFSTLYTFMGEPGERYRPSDRSAPVFGADGALYGATWGYLYRMVPNFSFELIYTFGSDPQDLTCVETTLVRGPDGKHYGTACRGPGADGMNGGLFRVAIEELASPITLSVTPSTITVGESATLSWSQPFTDCFAVGQWEGLRGSEGTEIVSPASPGSYQYKLGCSNWGHSEQYGAKTVFLTVKPKPRPPDGGAFGLSTVCGCLGFSAMRRRRARSA